MVAVGEFLIVTMAAPSATHPAQRSVCSSVPGALARLIWAMHHCEARRKLELGVGKRAKGLNLNRLDTHSVDVQVLSSVECAETGRQHLLLEGA